MGKERRERIRQSFGNWGGFCLGKRSSFSDLSSVVFLLDYVMPY